MFIPLSKIYSIENMRKTDSIMYTLAVVLLLILILFYLQTFNRELLSADINELAPVPTPILSIN